MSGMTSDGQSTGLQTKVFTPGEQHIKVHRNGIIAFTRAAPNDIATIAAMFMRCSPQSRLFRFFRLVPSAPSGYLEEVLADRDRCHAFVIRRNGETIGLAELHLTGPWSGDLALIVEDSFQRQGVGGAALQLLMCRARELGIRTLSSDVQIENSHVIRGLQRVGMTSMRRTHDILHIDFDLDAASNP
jgi:RimJ/RimL family protein N-acetyltransferase